MPTWCMYHVLEHFSIHILNSVDKTLSTVSFYVWITYLVWSVHKMSNSFDSLCKKYEAEIIFTSHWT